jgi:hypothetical protein
MYLAFIIPRQFQSSITPALISALDMVALKSVCNTDPSDNSVAEVPTVAAARVPATKRPRVAAAVVQLSSLPQLAQVYAKGESTGILRTYQCCVLCTSIINHRACLYACIVGNVCDYNMRNLVWFYLFAGLTYLALRDATFITALLRGGEPWVGNQVVNSAVGLLAAKLQVVYSNSDWKVHDLRSAYLLGLERIVVQVDDVDSGSTAGGALSPSGSVTLATTVEAV